MLQAESVATADGISENRLKYYNLETQRQRLEDNVYVTVMLLIVRLVLTLVHDPVHYYLLPL